MCIRDRYTNVKKTAGVGDIRSLCKQAMINKYRAVCVNSGFIRFCLEEFRSNRDVTIVSTAGFPGGGGSMKAKVYEAIFAEMCIRDRFEIPSRQDVRKCIITKDTVDGAAEPALVLNGEETEDSNGA